jgi:hypothetical protein
MKNKSITQKEVKEAEALVKGPLMVYRPWTKQEENAVADWVAKRKAVLKAKQGKP